MSAPARDRTEDLPVKSRQLCQLSYGGDSLTLLGHPALPPTFWAKVRADESGCWLWTGALNSRGYACFGVNGVSQLAHRVIYDALVAPIPDGFTIDHVRDAGCRHKHCVNPAHLEAVTLRENIDRAYRLSKPTHCPQGHEYTPENTRTKVRANGQLNRACRACEAAAKPAKAAREREKYRARLAETGVQRQRRTRYDTPS